MRSGESWGLIGKVVPPLTSSAEALIEMPPAELFPDEAEVVLKAVEKRRREFSVGRELARRALASLGHPPVPVLVGTGREPLWPDGIIGSITHCHTYCAAAVRRVDAAIIGLGIDAEPNEPLPAGVIHLIARPEETTWIREYPQDGPFWDRLLFSAKESVYKAWFPYARSWLDFLAARVRFEPSGQSFEVTLIDTGRNSERANTSLSGRYALAEGLLCTAATLQHAVPSRTATKAAQRS